MVTGCSQNRLIVTDNIMQDTKLQMRHNVLNQQLHSSLSVNIGIVNQCVGVDNIGILVKK